MPDEGTNAVAESTVAASGVNHLGIAVRSIADSRPFFEGVLGARFEGEEIVEDQKIKVAFLALGAPGHEVRLELLEPTSPDSTVAGFLEKKGEGLHHVAFTVNGIDKRLSSLEAEGVRLIDKEPRAGAHGAKIGFLHPKSTHGVLTELCEPAHHDAKGADA
ncbi:MAG: methylmalonyl-CoA epimerase [Planctomycetota bacterium]